MIGFDQKPEQQNKELNMHGATLNLSDECVITHILLWRDASFLFGARIWLGTILGRFSINYFSGLGLRISVRVWGWVRVRVRVWVRVSVGVGVRVSVLIWSG